jgi:metal-dependent hydrolase (beta-lactamase superfamily II)
VSSKTPTIHRLSVNLAPGAKQTFKDNDVSVQRAIFIPSGITVQNPFFTFGPTGQRFQLNTTAGVFIQFDEPFDELTIEVPATAGANATGDILMSGCSRFYMTNV